MHGGDDLHRVQSRPAKRGNRGDLLYPIDVIEFAIAGEIAAVPGRPIA